MNSQSSQVFYDANEFPLNPPDDDVFYNAQENSDEDIFEENLYQFIATNQVVPFLYHKLNDIQVQEQDLQLYNHLLKKNITIDDNPTFKFCRAYLYLVNEYKQAYGSNLPANKALLCTKKSTVSKVSLNVVDPSYIDTSLEDANFLVVVYGFATHNKSKTMHPKCIGMTTIKFNTYLPIVIGNNMETYKQPYHVFQNSLYIDIICSPFQKSNVASQIISMLESQHIRDTFKDIQNIPRLKSTLSKFYHKYIENGLSYEALSLKALSHSYMYFVTKCGFVRTNGKGFIYPFKVDANGVFYDQNDLVEFIKNNNLSTEQKSYFINSTRPTVVFGSDNDLNGYLCAKYLQPISGGSKLLKMKHNGHSYKIRFGSRGGRYILVKNKKIYV